MRVLAALLITLLFAGGAVAADYKGVDETVVEKFAQEHGRAASDPLINTDQGDLLLFVFMLGGAVGGFAAGYYYRVLTEQSSIYNAMDKAMKSAGSSTSATDEQDKPLKEDHASSV